MSASPSVQEHVGSVALNRFGHLVKVLCCPETKTSLQLLDAGELRSCVSDGDYERIREDTIGAFLSTSTGKAYPITPRVVSFLPQDAVRCHTEYVGAQTSIALTDEDEVKRGVKDWYDRFGWQRNDRGQYNDSAEFSQSMPIGHGLYELLSHLSIIDRLPGGDFVLDAASGAIAHPEYMAFSWFYKSRVCVDMSITALDEAYTKLRQTDFCCLADICELPFRDKTFDGAVSGYTIQHIPEAQQIRAIKELYRVIRPGAHLCIFTEVVRSRGHKSVVFLLRGLRKVMKTLRLVRPVTAELTSDAPQGELPPYALYFCPRAVKWWKEVASGLGAKCSIESLRLLDKPEFERLFGQSNGAAKALRFAENAFPKWTAGLSAFCLIDICKPPAGGKI